MKFNSILEYTDKIAELTERNLAIIDDAKVQVRSLNDEENSEFAANKAEILELKAEKEKFERNLQTNKYTKISIDRQMNTKESIIRSLSEAYNSGKRDNIVINRANPVHTVGAEGEDIVPLDLMNEIIMPLREQYLFGQVPVRVRTNLSGNVQIPIFNGGSLASDAHVGETGAAVNYTGTFNSITLTPHRFSVWTAISKQWLIQAIPNATDALIEDMGKQFWEEVEANLLSDNAATELKPGGLLQNLTATEVGSYRDLVNMEADLRELNYKNVSFALSPRAEAHFKSEIMGTANVGMIMQNGKVDGLDSVVSARIEQNQFLLADWSNIQFGFWENPTITFFEDFQLAQNGQIGIILSGFYDVKLLRDDAIALGEVVTE